MELFSSHCVFPVPDIEKTAEYYKTCLQFRPAFYLAAREPHVCLYRDRTEIILTMSNGQKVIPNRKLYGYGYDAYFITDDGALLQSEFEKAGVKIVKKLGITDFHNREFVIEDIDGRYLGFGLKKNE